MLPIYLLCRCADPSSTLHVTDSKCDRPACVSVTLCWQSDIIWLKEEVMQAQLSWEHCPVWQILSTWDNPSANYQKNWRIFSLWKPDDTAHKADNNISTKDYCGSEHVAKAFLIRTIPTAMSPRDFSLEEWDAVPLTLLTLPISLNAGYTCWTYSNNKGFSFASVFTAG